MTNKRNRLAKEIAATESIPLSRAKILASKQLSGSSPRSAEHPQGENTISYRPNPDSLVRFSSNVLLTGAPGSGKTITIRSMISQLASESSDSVEIWLGENCKYYGLAPAGLSRYAYGEEVLPMLRDVRDRITRGTDCDTASRELVVFIEGTDTLAGLACRGLAEERSEIEDLIVEIARTGSVVGVHLVLTAQNSLEYVEDVESLFPDQIIFRSPWFPPGTAIDETIKSLSCGEAIFSVGGWTKRVRIDQVS